MKRKKTNPERRYILKIKCGYMLWSKGIIWSLHICFFGLLPCKWWRHVWNVAMSQRHGRDCINAFCNVSSRSLYILPKKMLQSEASLEKIKSIHQSSGGLVRTAHFTLECSEKKPFTRPKVFSFYFFALFFFFFTRINEDLGLILGSNS